MSEILNKNIHFYSIYYFKSHKTFCESILFVKDVYIHTQIYIHIYFFVCVYTSLTNKIYSMKKAIR